MFNDVYKPTYKYGASPCIRMWWISFIPKIPKVTQTNMMVISLNQNLQRLKPKPKWSPFCQPRA